MDKKQEILEFMNQRPEALAIIGYGSGINPQLGQGNRKVQIDLIVIVDDIKLWHQANIKQNPKDYSFISKMFFKYSSRKALRSGAKICYMTYIPYKNNEYKIGTIEKSDFISDLENYDTFYMAGRMQKPILIVKADKKIEKAIEINRNYGLKITKLLLGQGVFDEEYFYNILAGLSYIGDTRMGIAENPNKIMNIVKGSFDFYHNVYGSRLDIDENNIIVDKESINGLPKQLNSYLMTNGNTIDKIRQFLTEKNKAQSRSQTIKGIFTTGPVKAIKYARAKLRRKSGK